MCFNVDLISLVKQLNKVEDRYALVLELFDELFAARVEVGQFFNAGGEGLVDDLS